MGRLIDAFAGLRRAFTRDIAPEDEFEEEFADEPVVEDGLLSVPAALPDPTPPRGECPEFEDLLASIGVEYESPSVDAIIARKDGEIAELRRMIAALRPLGERLAEIDKAELAGQASSQDELAETRAQLADERLRAAERKKRFLEKLQQLGDEHAALQARYIEMQQRVQRIPDFIRRAPKSISDLLAAQRKQQAELEDRERRIEELSSSLRKSEETLTRTKGWLTKSRTQREERARTAADRWKEILELRRQAKALTKELQETQGRLQRSEAAARE